MTAPDYPIQVETITRPLRAVVLMPATTTRRQLARVVRALNSAWGGSQSLLVPLNPDGHIASRWEKPLWLLDPDVLFVYGESRKRELARIRKYLNRHGHTPYWVVPFSEDLLLEGLARPVRVAASRLPIGQERISADFKGATPVDIAVLGLDASGEPPRSTPPAAYVENAGLTVVRGSPAFDALIDASEVADRPGAFGLLYHPRNDIESALWIWNLRAVIGPVVHGSDSLLAGAINQQRRSGARPTRVLCVAPPPASLRAELEKAGHILIDLPTFEWPGRGAMASPDFAVLDSRYDGTVRVPKREPTARVLGPSDSATEQGVEIYVIDAALRKVGDPLRVCFPKSANLNDIPLGTVTLGGQAYPLARFGFRCRVDREGDLAIAAPTENRIVQAIPLRLPTVAEAMSMIDPVAVYRLSDKGHYADLVEERSGGLDVLSYLLVDPAVRTLLSAFRANRFMSFEEMVAATAPPGTSKKGREAAQAWLTDTVNQLVSLQFLRFGVRVKCADCLLSSFINAGSLDATIECLRCGKRSQLGGVPNVGYQLAEVVFQFLQNDGEVTALAAAVLRRRSRIGFTSGFEHEYLEDSGHRGELDIFVISDGDIYVGEGKANGAIDRADCEKLRAVARRLGAKAAVVATLTECSGGCTPGCVSSRQTPSQTRDSALNSDPALGGPREQVAWLRDQLAPAIDVLVFCKGDLMAGFLAA